MNIVLKGQRVGGFSPKTVHFLFLFELLNETVSLGASAQSSANQPPASVSGLLHLGSPCLLGLPLSPSLQAVLRIASALLARGPLSFFPRWLREAALP